MTHNDITGDKIKTKVSTPEFRREFDRIFKKQFKMSYGRDCPGGREYKTETITAANLTEAVHKAEQAGWVVDGWEYLGLSCDD